jgi:hypothetical protein
MRSESKHEVFSNYVVQSTRACSHCGKRPALLRSMLNPKTGRTVRMFKCKCGEQTWLEDKV